MANQNNISKSQYTLARLVASVLNTQDVVFEATWNWMLSDKNRNMYVDIYVPKYKLAIEYQGQQHYNYPNRFHNNHDEFLRQRSRDKQKKVLLLKHGFLYVSWRYNEPLNLPYVMQRLEKLGIRIHPQIKEQVKKMKAPTRRRKRRKLNKTKRTAVK